jgi:protein-tyrosine-phosphatase
MTGTSRAQRMAMPLAREIVRDLAVEHGACIRPVQLRRRNLDTGQVDQVLVPCGHTMASVCPACAERNKSLRAAQCWEGWHLEDEPDIIPDPATDDQRWLVTQRAEAQQVCDLIAATRDDPADFDTLIAELDAQITAAGVRGKAAPAKPARRHRSTRRRARMPRTCPAARSAPVPSARPILPRTARPSARPCS